MKPNETKGMKTGVRVMARLVWLSIGITTIIVVLNGVFGGTFEITWHTAITLAYTVLYTFVLYFANAFVFNRLDKKFGNDRFSTKRIVLGFVLSFLVSVSAVFFLRVFEDVVIEGKTFDAFLSHESPANYVFALTITFIISLSAYAFYFYRAYQENKVKEQKIIAGTASAQFESLKNQIDPHFLFNSLNVLSALIEENPEAAQKFTTSLSKVYRYVLEQKDKELVTVEEELSFARTYMNLLKMRFENSLFYELPEKFDDPEAKVVPLSLQLLLENTVKHNVVSERKPLHIRIYAEGDYLVVANDLQRKEVLGDRKGVGLENIASRYAIITQRKVLVDETAEQFAVKIPILTRQVVVMEADKPADDAFYKAQKRVEELKGFYGNFWSFVVISIGLMVLNLVTYPQYLWFLFPVGGWGAGVLIHGMHVFNYMPFLGRDWEERKINEILKKEQSKEWK